MQHDVVLKHEEDGWYIYIDGVQKIGGYLPNKDWVIAKVEAKQDARRLGLYEIKIVELNGYREKESVC